MSCIKQLQLHILIGHHIGDIFGAYKLPGRTWHGLEIVLNKPLYKRLTNNRPLVLYAKIGLQIVAVQVDCRGRYPVHHAVRKRDLLVDPIKKIVVVGQLEKKNYLK